MEKPDVLVVTRTGTGVTDAGETVRIEVRVLKEPSGTPKATFFFASGNPQALRETGRENVFKEWGSNGRIITVTSWD